MNDLIVLLYVCKFYTKHYMGDDKRNNYVIFGM